MPIYEYVCEACGHEVEHLARSLSEAAPPCPHCQARKLRKKLSVFAPASPSAGAKPSGDFSGGCGRCGDPNGPCS